MNQHAVGVGVVAKAPVAGHTKTRLCPPLTPVQAAALYRALLGDTLEMVEGFPSTRRYLFAAREHDGVAVLSSMFPAWRTVAQAGGNLGARLEAALNMMLEDGCATAIILGSDAPLVPLGELIDACPWLLEPGAGRRALFGPSGDGGYWALAVSRACPELFVDIQWSTGEVMKASRQRGQDAGITLREVSVAFDVDDGPSLRVFLDAVTQRGGAPRCVQLLKDAAFLAAARG